jgi:type IX secretion system PorP/SprF family membrane protein
MRFGIKKIFVFILYFHLLYPAKKKASGNTVSFLCNNCMRKYILVFFIIYFSCQMVVVAQQDPQFSQHMFTKLYYNPGFAGANDAICGTLLYRNQWTGFGGEPKTMLFLADMPIDALHGGVGLAVHALDNLGASNSLNVRGCYAYRTDLGAGRIAIGAAVGYMQESLNGNKLIYNDAGDQNIPSGNVSGGTYDLGLGIYYNTDVLYIGLASSHLTANDLKYGDITTKIARHYFLQAGYSIDLTSSLALKPSLIAKTDAVETQFDINTNLMINNKYWVGASYRLQDAIIIMAGLEIMPNLKFGYSYDLTTSDIKSYSSGTHEIVIGYCFNPAKTIKRQFHRNVRSL